MLKGPPQQRHTKAACYREIKRYTYVPAPSALVTSAVFTRDADGHRVLISGTTPAQFYAVEAGFWWLTPLLLSLSGLPVVTASLAGLVWLVYALRRRLPAARVLPRLPLLLATLAFAATAWAFFNASATMGHLGHLSVESVLLFVGRLVFAGCGLLLVRFRQFRSRLAPWYLLLTYAVLGTYGWLGMRLWSV